MRKSNGALFWDRLVRYPPILCRLLARVPRGRPLTDVEIADRGGLSALQVQAIGNQTDWTGIDLPTARRFMVGCDTDLSHRPTVIRIYSYLRNEAKNPANRFVYLRKAPNWTAYYRPLLTRFHQHLLRKDDHGS